MGLSALRGMRGTGIRLVLHAGLTMLVAMSCQTRNAEPSMAMRQPAPSGAGDGARCSQDQDCIVIDEALQTCRPPRLRAVHRAEADAFVRAVRDVAEDFKGPCTAGPPLPYPAAMAKCQRGQCVALPAPPPYGPTQRAPTPAELQPVPHRISGRPAVVLRAQPHSPWTECAADGDCVRVIEGHCACDAASGGEAIAMRGDRVREKLDYDSRSRQARGPCLKGHSCDCFALPKARLSCSGLPACVHGACALLW